MSDYKKKYLKYKKKYLNIRKIHGGANQWYSPQAYPQQAPQAYPQPAPQAYPQHAPQGYSQHAPQAYPQHVSQGYSQHAPQAYPQHVSQGYSQHAPQAYSQHAPQAYPQHAPHGMSPQWSPTAFQQSYPPQQRSSALDIKESPKKLADETITKTDLDKLKKSNEKLQDRLNNTKAHLEICEKNKEDLNKIAITNGWDVSKNDFEIPYFFPSENQLFEPSGPFVFNKRIKEIEDEVTEYKDYENIYSNYDGEGGKSLDYKPDKVETTTPKQILFKNIIAFLNTRGGRLFFGITDSLVIRGIKNINTDAHRDHFIREITHGVYNEIEAYDIVNKTISPPPAENIAFIWHYIFNSEESDKKIYILEIQVNPGSPNYIYKKGSDVWFRHAGSVSSYDLASAKAIIKQRNEAKKDNRYHNCPKLEMDEECEEEEV